MNNFHAIIDWNLESDRRNKDVDAGLIKDVDGWKSMSPHETSVSSTYIVIDSLIYVGAFSRKDTDQKALL
jgi:hypothetical protein